MLSLGLDPDLDRVLERDVDDLARYNILRFLHDNPGAHGGVSFYADRLGLRSLERVGDALEALVRRGFLEKRSGVGDGLWDYALSQDPDAVELVDRLYELSETSHYGDIVERLAARSLHRARRSQPTARGEHA